MTYFWIASYVFFGLALLTLIRIKMEPQDNIRAILLEIRADIKLLLEMHTPPKQIDIGKVNKEIGEELRRIKNSRSTK